MPEITERLQLLRQADQDVASILNVFDEIDRVYKAALEAMGLTSAEGETVGNSASVTITFRPDESAHSLTING
jgi:hypothetical protein